MARHAVLAEVARDMVRVRCFLEIAQVALGAVCKDQLVVAVRVACLALQRRMRSGQREVRCTVIERRRGPPAGRMACQAVVAELAGDMVGIGHLLVIR